MTNGFFELSNTKIVSRAESAVLTLAEAKAHLRVPFEDDDALISGYILAASDYIESVIECPVMPAAMSLNFDVVPAQHRTHTHLIAGHSDRVYIPVRNTTSVEQVLFDGNEADTASYALNTLQSVPYLQFSGRFEAKQITLFFTAGFAPVPTGIKQAALLTVGHWYKNTSAVV